MTDVDVSRFALKSNLASSKNELDKIDGYKLKTVHVYLSKLSNVVNNDIVKKTMFEKLVTKVNDIDTTGFVFKTKYDTDKSELEEKIIDPEQKIPNTNAKQTIILKLLK